MKSLYKRELTMMVGIVALSFTLLSTAFMLLSYRYIISETRDRLERNAGYIAAATSDYLQNVDSLSLLDGIKWTLYQSTMETVSAVSEASVIVTDTQGEILYATDSGLYHRQIPDRVVQQILQQGHYNGITNLGGIYEANRYIAGLPVQTKLTPTLAANLGLVLVSGDTSGLSEMWRATATIFFFAAVVVLLIAVIASSLTSAHQTRPRWRRRPESSGGANLTCGSTATRTAVTRSESWRRRSTPWPTPWRRWRASGPTSSPTSLTSSRPP